MKVLKRTQVTEVVVRRQVSHKVKIGESIYNRHETISNYVPYMNCDIINNKSKVKWNIETGERTVRYLSAKEVKLAKLNELFSELDIVSKNGNVKC